MMLLYDDNWNQYSCNVFVSAKLTFRLVWIIEYQQRYLFRSFDYLKNLILAEMDKIWMALQRCRFGYYKRYIGKNASTFLLLTWTGYRYFCNLLVVLEGV